MALRDAERSLFLSGMAHLPDVLRIAAERVPEAAVAFRYVASILETQLGQHLLEDLLEKVSAGRTDTVEVGAGGLEVHDQRPDLGQLVRTETVKGT